MILVGRVNWEGDSEAAGAIEMHQPPGELNFDDAIGYGSIIFSAWSVSSRASMIENGVSTPPKVAKRSEVS